MTASYRRWLLLAIPQVLLFGGMAVMFVVHPNAITAGVQSTRAIAVNAVLLAGWLLLSLVIVPHVIKSATWDAVLLSVVAVAAVAILVVPTLRDTKVVEEFPQAAAEPTVSTTLLPGVPAEPTTEPPVPVKISTGELRGIGHDATGTASIFRQPNGRAVVALEAIDIEPGPDYRVIVARGTDVRAPATGSNSTRSAGTRAPSTTKCHPVPTPVTDGPCSSGVGRSEFPSPTPVNRQCEKEETTCSAR